MASDVMSVRLWLPRIKVEGVVVDAPEELVWSNRSAQICRACGRGQ